MRSKTVISIIAILALSVVLFEVLPQQPSTSRPKQSGPISTYPAAWTSVCNRHVKGNRTTNDQLIPLLQDGTDPNAANLSLDKVYERIVSSPAFLEQSAGDGWVTASWGLIELSNRSGSERDILALFVLTTGHSTDGYVLARYNILSGKVSVQGQAYLTSGSCPATDSVAIEYVQFNVSSRTISVVVRNVGLENVTLSTELISAASGSAGYKGSITLDLRRIRLASSDSVQLTSPPLSNLTAGDNIEIKVTTSVGTYATTFAPVSS